MQNRQATFTASFVALCLWYDSMGKCCSAALYVPKSNISEWDVLFRVSMLTIWYPYTVDTYFILTFKLSTQLSNGQSREIIENVEPISGFRISNQIYIARKNHAE